MLNTDNGMKLSEFNHFGAVGKISGSGTIL